MADTIFNRFWFNLALGNIDWSTDTFAIALMEENYVPSKRNDALWGDISSYEIEAGNGYDNIASVSRKILSCTLEIHPSLNQVEFKATDPEWHGSITASKAVVIQVNDSDISASRLICCIDWGEVRRSLNSEFSINIDHTNSTENVLVTLKQY